VAPLTALFSAMLLFALVKKWKLRRSLATRRESLKKTPKTSR
jgi:hypothetical protein